MVDVAGHVGMALLWLAPAWLVVDDYRTAAAFVALGAPLGMLPDADLYVRHGVPTVKHHGVFHTVLAVGAFAVLLAPVLGLALRTLDDAVAGPFEAFWPLYRRSLGYDVIYYDSLVWNAAFLLAGVAVNVALWRWRRRD